MKFLITGTAGFIGSQLTRRLTLLGHDVVGVDNFDDYYSRRAKELNLGVSHETLSKGDTETIARLEKDGFLESQNDFKIEHKRVGSHYFSEGDIRDYEFLEKLFKKYKPDVVIHLAAKAGVKFSINDPMGYTRTNVVGTTNILELCRLFHVKQTVIASSSSIYGNLKTTPFTEEMDVDKPVSPYAATKRATEILGSTYATLHKMNITFLRFFTVYGPLQRPYGMAIQKFIKQIGQGHPLTVYGDGLMARDYTYITDIIDGIVGASNLPGYNIINLGNSSPVNLQTLTAKIIKIMGKGTVKNIPRPATEVDITFADISKAKELFGYNPKVDIDTGLRNQIDAFKLLPDWYRNLEDFV